MNAEQFLLPADPVGITDFQLDYVDANYAPFDAQPLLPTEDFLLKKAKKDELFCIVCPKVYVCKKFLQRHKTFHHHLCKPVQQLDCEHCGAFFADVESHKTHLEETDNHLKEFFSVGLPQKIKQMKRAEDLSALRKKTQDFQLEDEMQLKEFFILPEDHFPEVKEEEENCYPELQQQPKKKAKKNSFVC